MIASYENASNNLISTETLLYHPHPEQLRYYPVKLTGHFLNNNVILLDNKVNNGQVGYSVYVPFVIPNMQKIFLVNRGWIPQGKSRSHLPSLSPIIGEVTIEGLLDIAYRNRFISTSLENTVIQWPLRMQQIDLTLIKEILGNDIYPMLVSLDKKSPTPYLNPERHLGYAVQWFALAITFLLLCLFFKFKNKKSK